MEWEARRRRPGVWTVVAHENGENAVVGKSLGMDSAGLPPTVPPRRLNKKAAHGGRPFVIGDRNENYFLPFN